MRSSLEKNGRKSDGNNKGLSMNARVAFGVRLLALGIGLLSAAGCSLLPEPKPDPTRFYVLATSTPGILPPAGAPVVQLRPVELAGYLRTPPLVVRRGEHEIEFREYARWGEPLEQGLGRVLREELQGRGAAVMAGAGREYPGSDYTLAVRVLACEGTAAGAVEFRAVWELTKTGDKAVATAGGEFRAADLRWEGKTEAVLVARLSEAVAGLAAEIAGKLARR